MASLRRSPLPALAAVLLLVLVPPALLGLARTRASARQGRMIALNWAQIQPGMGEHEVEELLGGPPGDYTGGLDLGLVRFPTPSGYAASTTVVGQARYERHWTAGAGRVEV